jgi:hypothetical protein
MLKKIIAASFWLSTIVYSSDDILDHLTSEPFIVQPRSWTTAYVETPGALQVSEAEERAIQSLDLRIQLEFCPKVPFFLTIVIFGPPDRNNTVAQRIFAYHRDKCEEFSRRIGIDCPDFPLTVARLCVILSNLTPRRTWYTGDFSVQTHTHTVRVSNLNLGLPIKPFVRACGV